jgi:hypothetical protein
MTSFLRSIPTSIMIVSAQCNLHNFSFLTSNISLNANYNSKRRSLVNKNVCEGDENIVVDDAQSNVEKHVEVKCLLLKQQMLPLRRPWERSRSFIGRR